MPTKLAALCVVLGSLVAFCPAGDYVEPTALQETGFVKFWQLQLPLADQQRIRDAYLVDDQLYLATWDGDVFAVHAQTGVLRWRKRVTTGGYRILKPAHGGGRTIFVLPTAIVQYDRYTGQPLMRLEPRFPLGSPAICDGLVYYVGGIDRKMHAFVFDRDFEHWQARAGGPIVSQPQLFGKYLYYASDNGNIYACVARNKKFHWLAKTQGAVTADLVVDKNGVYVAGRDNALYLFDPDMGGLRWRARFSASLTEPPVVTEAVAYQFSQGDGVVAVNTGTVGVERRIRWSVPEARRMLTVDGNHVILFGREPSLIVADIETGRIRATVETPGMDFALPSPDDPAIYLASSDGRLFCARKIGTPRLTADDIRKALTPPGTEQQPAARGAAASKTPSRAEENPLASQRPGPPIGGKSKVTREFVEKQSEQK